ncbi:MAG: hypothetical protein HA494_05480 [Thaumarchaeota archaeon]|nr:hypothetical protein [Nitrososphaerota archaeon]
MATMIPSIGEKRGKQIVYTIEECLSCGEKSKRSFTVGDYVYKGNGQCKKCGGNLYITMIYAEPLKPTE